MLVLLGALLAVTGPNGLDAGDVCLVRRVCGPEPVFCLVDDPRCPGSDELEICFVNECAEPRGPGSLR